MTLRRKTRKKATFNVESGQYLTEEVLLVIDCRDFYILRTYRKPKGGQFQRHGEEAWIGKALVEVLAGLNYHLNVTWRINK